jgi:hypothetical protein
MMRWEETPGRVCGAATSERLTLTTLRGNPAADPLQVQRIVT